MMTAPVQTRPCWSTDQLGGVLVLFYLVHGFLYPIFLAFINWWVRQCY